MCRFSEAIKLKDGVFYNLSYHQERIDETFQKFFPSRRPFDIANLLLKQSIPKGGLYKCRVLYGDIPETVQILSYKFRKIESLKIVFDDKINYSSKFADRERLDYLFSLRSGHDDIIIIKNGLVTDSFASNIVFISQEKIVTSANPLLNGITRRRLIKSGFLSEVAINHDDIFNYDKVKLINAMTEWDNAPEINVNRIYL
jgi:4-amino-4-deoxychorismate lyase